jgi:hypothetical protein
MVGGGAAADEVLMGSLGAAWHGTSLASAGAFAARLLARLGDRPPAGVPDLP